MRADLEVVALRGNVDTRLRKLEDGELALAAIVLARAGLQRLGRESDAGGVLDPTRFVPAPGQGVLALEGRAGDASARARRAGDHRRPHVRLPARPSVRSRRELGASCHTPLGAHAVADAPGRLRMRGWVGLPDGSAWILDELDGARLRAGGARTRRSPRECALRAPIELLARAGEMAHVAGR